MDARKVVQKKEMGKERQKANFKASTNDLH